MCLFEVTKIVCIAFISGTFTMAFPLLLQSISRIDEKYKSSILTRRFKKEKIYYAFHWALYISLGWVFYHFIVGVHKHWTPNNCPLLNKFMPYSSSILLISLTIILIVMLIILIRRIMVYYDHNKLMNSIFKKFKDFGDIKDEDLNALLALSKYNLKRNDDDKDVVYELYNKLYNYAYAKYLDNDK